MNLIYQWIYDRKYLLLAFILILGFIQRIPSVFGYLGGDEAIIAYYSLRILQGSILYRDLFDTKPPGLFFIVALIFWIFGNNIIIPRIFSMLVSCFTGIPLFFIGKKIRNTITGLAAALLFVFDPLSLKTGIVIHAGSTMIFFMVVSVYFYTLTDKNKQSSLLFLVGIFIGISTIIKQPGILILPVILLDLFLKKNSYKSLLKYIVYISSGTITAMVPVVLSFLFTKALDHVFFALILFNLSFSKEMTPFAKFHNFYYYVLLRNPLIWIIGVLGLLFANKSKKDWNFLITGWFVLSLLAIMSLKTPWDHYYLQVVPPLCLSCSIFLQELFSTKTVKLNRLKVDIIKVGTCFLFLSIIIYAETSLYTNPRYSTKLSMFSSELEGQNQVASYIIDHTNPDDKIFATHAAYYFLTGREGGYKFQHLSSVVVEFYGIGDLPEYLEMNKVQYLILDGNARNFILNELTYNWYYDDEVRGNEVIEIQQWIVQHYFVEKIFLIDQQEIQIYRSMKW
jgi:hypothetical protein